MEETAKKDNVFGVLGQAIYCLDSLGTWFDDIKTLDLEEGTSKSALVLLFECINDCQPKCWECRITSNEIYNEHWAISKDINDLPNVANRLIDEFEVLFVGKEQVLEDSYTYKARGFLKELASKGYIDDKQIITILDSIVILRSFVKEWAYNICCIIERLDKNNFECWTSKQEPQPQSPLQETEREKKYFDNKPTTLPEALNTNKAESLLQKVISAGFCDTNYRWKKTKALLAYFADRASEYLDLGRGEYDGKAKTSWKPFESLFGISELAGAKKDYQRTGTLPDGYKDVNKLFE